MRKVLFFLLLLSATHIWGQIPKEVQFDFTNPSSIGGTWIIPDKDKGQTSVDISKSSATAGAIQLSFKKGAAGIGAQCTEVDGSYFLKITASTTMTFASTNGAAITEIRFSDDSSMGTLHLTDGIPGELEDINTMRRLWQCAGNYDVHTVAYVASGKEAELKKVVIKYLDPANVLDAVSTSLPSTGSLTSFNEMNITFASAMTLTAGSTDKIYIEDADGKKYAVKVIASDSGRVFTISVDTPLQDGNYKVVIPGGCFERVDGYCNKDLQYSFTVDTPKNILKPESVTPATGKVEKLESGIVLTFEKPVKLVKNEAMLYKDNEEWSPVNLKRNDSKSVELTFDIPEGLTENGEYKIVVPEHSIENQVGKLYNPELVLVYTIGETENPDNPDNPDEPDVPEDTEVMKQAKALLENTGVGYPAVGSAARTELATLTTATEVPTDEALTAAIEKFYNESVIALPENGKYYTIATKNAVADTLYLKYDKGSFVLVANKDDATSFEAESGEGVFSFKTADGKYVAVDGVTDDAVRKNIKMEKLNIKDVDAVNLFGCVSLYGSTGQDVLGNENHAYALVNYDSKKYGAIEDLYYTEKLSSAFILENTDAPAIDTVAVVVKYDYSESVLSANNNVIAVSFPDISDIKVSADVKAYIASKADATDKDKLYDVIAVLDAAAEKKNGIKASCPSDLKKGKYYLIVPEGQILYTSEGVLYTNKRFTVAFDWDVHEVSDEFVKDFNYYYRSPNKVTATEDELNHVSIASAPYLSDSFYLDETKVVELWQLDSGRMVRTGHFVKTDREGLLDVPGSGVVYDLILDTPINEGDLSVGDKYTFIIPAATFGDKNFEAYMKGDKTVDPTQCHVNDVVKITYHLVAPTGINDIENDGSEKVIYTITGRCVKSMNAPGIYIVNGKKVIKK